jgi:HSP20 family molecular chaperone IbpA
MWGESLAALERADRLQSQFCQLAQTGAAYPSWEPPADVVETATQVAVMIALPGVDAEHVSIELDGAAVIVRATRGLSPQWRQGHIHCLELPYGKFERRVELPLRPLALGQCTHRDGCVLLVFDKPGGSP